MEDSKGEFDYDLFVIGGGSGGLAMVKEAVDLAAKANNPFKAALADFVKPTPKGTKWGLGGTCVNVGCIPKKLMHFAALMGDNFPDAREAGWNAPEKPEHDWKKMKANVAKHIRKLNWGYKKQLIEKQIKYYNNLASFVDPHTLLVSANAILSWPETQTRR